MCQFWPQFSLLHEFIQMTLPSYDIFLEFDVQRGNNCSAFRFPVRFRAMT